jgi:hypothetical protein
MGLCAGLTFGHVGQPHPLCGQAVGGGLLAPPGPAKRQEAPRVVPNGPCSHRSRAGSSTHKRVNLGGPS